MKEEKFNKPEGHSRVLVAPLDWGLGHATRCVPIINELLLLGCTVFIGAEGQVKALLQKEFPSVKFIELKGYRIQYSRNKFWMPLKMLWQLPKIIYRIYAENRWLKKVVAENKIDAVISDNRMGLYHKQIMCIYITHQLAIKTGMRLTEAVAQKIHYHYINKFSACWVPDAAAEKNLAGGLSHPVTLPKIAVKYIGALSRFEKKGQPVTYDVCIVLSGPEPQRSIFEKILLAGIEKVQQKIMLVRGLPQQTEVPVVNNPLVEIKNHLPADLLSEIIQQSKIIISRCGYSTVMDLMKLQKKAILVPTPGQTEREYLAAYLHGKKMFLTAGQQNFSLTGVLKQADEFAFEVGNIDSYGYKAALENFVSALKNQ